MTIRVMVADDSGFFRRRVIDALKGDPEFEIVGLANNGLEAVEKITDCKPHVVVMDVEMPVMDGITAVRKIMAIRPTPILMFSTLTHAGAQATLDALAAGALDFLPKRFQDIASDPDEANRVLRARVRAVAGARIVSVEGSPAALKSKIRAGSAKPSSITPRRRSAKLILLASSTGGPSALPQVLSGLPANYPLPILLIQHMPASYTAAFAERLNQLSPLTVTEAKDGDILRPGHVLLAPGSQQTIVMEESGKLCVRIYEENAPNIYYRPSVDVALRSAIRSCQGRVTAVILTGMGSDGCEAAGELKRAGGVVWAQDEASCVIYGMPGAVVKAGIAERVLPLSEIANELSGIY